MPVRAMKQTTAAVKRPMRSPEPAPPAHAPALGRVWDADGAGAPSAILAIQRAAGNQAVMRMLDARRPGHALAGPSTAVQRSSENELDDDEDVQRAAAALHEPSDEAIRSAAVEGVRTPATTLPHLDRIQASFGRHSIAHVQAHIGPEAARASRAMNALAYASGNHVVFGATPDLRTTAHEAAHIVQQQAGVQLSGGIGRAGDPYERHADAVADAVVAGRPAEEELGPFAVSAAPRQSRNPIPGVGQVLRAVRGAEDASAGQGAAPREVAAVARKEVAADNIQRMLRWEQLVETKAGIAWKKLKTRPTPQKEKTAEKYRSKGYGATIRDRPEAPSEWKSEITAEEAGGFLGSKNVTAERLGPDVKEGDESAKLADPMKWPHCRKLNKAHNDALTNVSSTSAQAGTQTQNVAGPFKPVTVLPRSLGGNGRELGHVVFLPEDKAQQLREKVHPELKAVVKYGMAWVKLKVNTTYTYDMRAKLKYASRVAVTFEQLDPQGQKVPGTKKLLEVPGRKPSDTGNSGTYPSSMGQQQPNASQKPVPLTGKPDDKAAVRWHTRVKFKPTDPTTGDGTEVEANPLGPDHKLGEEPGDKGIWKKRTEELHKASGNKTRYIAGHLLNHHLGGPGNDARNLAPIPDSTNGEHSRNVEQPLKQIVNKEQGWVYYHVKVTHNTETINNKVVRYPSELKCTYYPLDSLGKQHGSKHVVTIPINAPSPSWEKSDAKDELEMTGTGNKLARARVAYDEVILDLKDTLRDQRAFMDQLIKVLRKLGVNRYILEEDPSTLENSMVLMHAVVPGPAEVDALKKLKSQFELWEKSSQGPASTATPHKEATDMMQLIEDARKEQVDAQKDLIGIMGDQVDSQTIEDVKQSITTAQETWSNSLNVMRQLLKIGVSASEQLKAKDAELEDARKMIAKLEEEGVRMKAEIAELKKKNTELKKKNHAKLKKTNVKQGTSLLKKRLLNDAPGLDGGAWGQGYEDE